MDSEKRSEILSLALDKPEEERGAFIHSVSHGDLGLENELNELLLSFKEASGFFDGLAARLRLPGTQHTEPSQHTMNSDPSALIGQMVAQYRISDFLGGGGMGMVYRAEDTRLGRKAALKFLPVSMGRDPEAKERFLREARAASALDHPNICTIFEIGEDAGRSFIAMALYEGKTFEQLVSRGPLDIEQSVNWAVEVCSGLASAHGKGIIHRDIKPANIIVTDEGSTKILDFGLAKSDNAAVVTQEGMVLGTAAYMSPEQATGKTVDHRTDIWSTGAVLYEMLSGSRPFPGQYPQAVLYGINNLDPEPLSALRPGLPMQLVQVIEKALAKQASNRFQNMAEMANALKAVQQRATAKSAARHLVAQQDTVQKAPSAQDVSYSEPENDVLHILCVDDEPELELLMQQRFRKKLRAGEWKFVFALDGQEALLKLEQHPEIGVILTDLNMPRMDGLTLLGKLAELDRPTRTVVVSAYGDMEKIRTAMNRGAFDFVTKPVDFQDLETTTLKAASDLAEYHKALRGQQQAVSIQQEMDVARRIQDAIIPVSFPQHAGLEIYGFSAPAADVSGTFYDAFDLKDGRIGMLMGDVGGRGVTAALLMAMGQTFVKSFMQQGISPESCLSQLNTMLFADGLPHVGLRMMAMLLDPASGELSLANAGHESPMILRASGQLDSIEGHGSAIWENKAGVFEASTISLQAGDAVVFFSKGVAQTVNETGASYSRERLASALRETADTKPTSLIRHLIRSVQEHAGDNDPRED
ncbi:protein kinase, partial [bacterium]|nr:protein kinase [bacterium]